MMSLSSHPQTPTCSRYGRKEGRKEVWREHIIKMRKALGTYFFAPSRKSCQDMSPLRKFMLKRDPLVGIIIAIGDFASITLLQK